jgi:nucleoside-diphosphate-sugar epimerase
MRTIIITGSAGLIGSEAVKRFAKKGARVVGIDNDMRAQFFGAEASTKKTIRAPRVGEVYNIGGSRHSNCSMLEAIDLCEEISGRKLMWSYEETNRIGDHIWSDQRCEEISAAQPRWKFRCAVADGI